ncbi:uncharacterized protein JCM10292_001722 [Rhodotorula paludigena]|uniref:uncharacterized protein n=1 Tax=Rhodotorula paludigena TaxID=86838 RepID=UPI00317971B9
MSGYDSAGTSGAGGKRRRANLDPDFYPGTAPTTSRTKANYKAQQEAQQRAASSHALAQQQQQSQYEQQHQHARQPVLSLASFPPDALQRYLSRYGLFEPQGSLSYHHAVFPVPALPETLHPPLQGRALAVRRARQTYVPAARNARIEAAQQQQQQRQAEMQMQIDEAAQGGAGGAAGPSGGAEAGADEPAGAAGLNGGGSATQRPWLEPKTPEFAGLSAFDEPHRVVERLAARATQHWEKRDSLKEAETLTNFMFSVRNRGHTLRATPAG